MAIYLQIAVLIGNGDQEENLKGLFHEIESGNEIEICLDGQRKQF